MPPDLGKRVLKGLGYAAIGTAIAGIVTALLKSGGSTDLEGPIGIVLIVASLAYWAWTKRDQIG